MMQKKYDLYCGAAKKYFWDEKQKLFVSGKDRQVSYASQVWLILGGAANQKEGINILHRVAQHQNAVRIVTPYMYHYYIQSLIDCGMNLEAKEALNILGRNGKAGG